MDAVLGCLRSFFNSLCCGSCIDEVDDPKDLEKLPSYKDVIKKECELCLDDFQKTDFVARTIIGTPCCPNSYFHADCLAGIARDRKITCPHCYVKFDEKENRKNWESFARRVAKRVETDFALRDEEVARELDAELKAKDKEEQSRIQKQIEEDARMAILLSRQ